MKGHLESFINNDYKLFNHVKSGSDDASNVLITDSLFSLTVYIVVSSAFA